MYLYCALLWLCETICYGVVASFPLLLMKLRTMTENFCVKLQEDYVSCEMKKMRVYEPADGNLSFLNPKI